MSLIAKIHVLKKHAALDEDTYRDLLERETGKRSSKGMATGEQLKVVRVLEGLAGSPRQVGSKTRASGQYAGKLQALWIAAHNLGVVHNRSDKAMMAFLKRQTGLDHHSFLQNGEDAAKAIDALKAWIRRETGNDSLFTSGKHQTPIINDHRFQVTRHIWTELVKRDAAPAGTLGAYVQGLTGTGDLSALTSADWIETMNALGKLMRGDK